METNPLPLVRNSHKKNLGLFNEPKIDTVTMQKFQAMFPHILFPIVHDPTKVSSSERALMQQMNDRRLSTPRGKVNTKRWDIELARLKDEERKLSSRDEEITPPHQVMRMRTRNGPLHAPDKARLEEALMRRAILEEQTTARHKNEGYASLKRK